MAAANWGDRADRTKKPLPARELIPKRRKFPGSGKFQHWTWEINMAYFLPGLPGKIAGKIPGQGWCFNKAIFFLRMQGETFFATPACEKSQTGMVYFPVVKDSS